MRKYLWMAGLTLGLSWTGSAHAQFSRTINIMPSFTNNSPMSYQNQNAPIGGTITRSVTTKLSQLFYTPSRTNTINNTIVNGQSVFPTPAQMHASAPAYFVPFQMRRSSFITP